MCYIACKICDKQLDIWTEPPVKHECKEEDIQKRIELLEERASLAERKLWEIQNEATLMIKGIIEANEEWFPKTRLQSLWECLQLNAVSATDVDSFTGQWLGMHQTLIRASDIFRKNRRHNAKKPLSYFFQQLLNSCEKTRKEYDYDCDFKTVEELFKEIKEENR